MSPRDRCAAERRAGRGFTLTELLVVIIIIVVIASIAIPSFSSMMRSSEAALAETRLLGVLRAARDAAVRSAGDDDSAVVFFYEPGGRLTAVVCSKAGVLKDKTARSGGNGTNTDIYREVFVPVDFMQPVQLPRGWMVRGYAPPGTIDDESNASDYTPREGWYDFGPGGQAQARYGKHAPDAGQLGDWVFPETGFFIGNTPETYSDPNANASGASRQTFMVRFEAGTGRMASGTFAPVLVVAPRPTALGRNAAPFGAFRIDRAQDLRRFVRRVLQDPMIDEQTGNVIGAANREQFRRDLLGDKSSDTVLAGPVTQVALYEEAALVRSLDRGASPPGQNPVRGVRIDSATECLYRPIDLTVNVATPRFVQPATGTSLELGEAIGKWIEGDTNFDDSYGDRSNGDEPQARLFTLDRYTGEVRRVEVEQ